uniref:(northern house mosquito) hypothetical protein n=1 Tax=Culex pipiens TaxID=7175 RepID=A0A8D8HKM8_CULPI
MDSFVHLTPMENCYPSMFAIVTNNPFDPVCRPIFYFHIFVKWRVCGVPSALPGRPARCLAGMLYGPDLVEAGNGPSGWSTKHCAEGYTLTLTYTTTPRISTAK